MEQETPVKDLHPAICSVKYFSQRCTMVFLSLSLSILYLPLTLKSQRKCSLRLLRSPFLLMKQFMFRNSSQMFSSFQNIPENSIARDQTARRSSSLNYPTTFRRSLTGSTPGGSAIKAYPCIPSPPLMKGSSNVTVTLTQVCSKLGSGVSAVLSTCCNLALRVMDFLSLELRGARSIQARMTTGFRSLMLFKVLGLALRILASSSSLTAGDLQRQIHSPWSYPTLSSKITSSLPANLSFLEAFSKRSWGDLKESSQLRYCLSSSLRLLHSSSRFFSSSYSSFRMRSSSALPSSFLDSFFPPFLFLSYCSRNSLALSSFPCILPFSNSNLIHLAAQANSPGLPSSVAFHSSGNANTPSTFTPTFLPASGYPSFCISCITSVREFQKGAYSIIEMEERSGRWQVTEGEGSPKKGYFRNFLKSETRRFSSLVIANSISIDDKRLYFKIFVLSLEKPPHERTEEDELATAKVLNEENIFPEFQNDLNVLRLFAKALKVRQCAAGEYLLTPKTKDEHLYKVMKGETVRRDSEGRSVTRGKGELVERVEEFQVIKEAEVVCREETFLLAIHHRAYEEAMKLYLQNKITLKMLVKTALFSSFKRKELSYLLEKAQERQFASKDALFTQGDPTNDSLYFLVEGEVLISKWDSLHCPQIVCYLGEGSLFGEETLFQERQRSYTAIIHSSTARVVLISSAAFTDMLAHFELPREQFFTQCGYGEFLAQRSSHYEQKLAECAHIKKVYRSLGQVRAMAGGRQQQMHDMLREVENYALQLQTKEKLLEKRNQLSRSQIISVERPLFGREDLAGWKQPVRRNQAAQKGKENCRLPHLH